MSPYFVDIMIFIFQALSNKIILACKCCVITCVITTPPLARVAIFLLVKAKNSNIRCQLDKCCLISIWFLFLAENFYGTTRILRGKNNNIKFAQRKLDAPAE